MDNHADRPEIAAALAGTRRHRQARLAHRRASKSSTSRSPPPSAARRSRCASSQPLTEIDAVAARSSRIGLALLAVALAIAVVIAAWASAAAARPVARALRRRRAGWPRATCRSPMPEVPGDLQVLADSLATLRQQMRARLDALEAEQRTLRTALDGLTDAVFLLEGETHPLRQRRRRPHLPLARRAAGATTRYRRGRAA